MFPTLDRSIKNFDHVRYDSCVLYAAFIINQPSKTTFFYNLYLTF